GTANVLQHCVALDPHKKSVAKRELVGVGRHVHSGNREQIEIHIAFHRPARAADIEIPPPQGKVLRLPRIHEEGRRRLQRAPQPGPGGPAPVDLCEVHYFAFGSSLRFPGRVNRSSFRSLLISTESAYISKILSPLRSRRTSNGHFT